jgi:hypothetical protein
MAQTTPPVLILNIVDIQVTDDTVGGVKLLSGGAGYSGNAPAISFTGGGGVGAYATANLVGGGNAVGSVTVSADPFPPFYAIGGSGYVGPPTVTFVGGGLSGIGATPPTEATGQAYLNVAQDFPTPNQNEGYGPAGDTIGMLALASGTQPESGFVYAFTVNGLSIGETSQSATPGEPAGIYWTPPLPGIYSIVATTTDGNGNSATSPPIRYFAEGTVIVSPEAGGVNPASIPVIAAPGSIVTVGSTVVIQATSTSKDGFISKVVFYTDWNGTTGTLIGSATNYPYSVIYQPAGPATATHLIKAVGYDNNGNIVPSAAVPTNPNQDEILLTMGAANPAGLPTATIVTPGSGSLVQIPNYLADPAATIPVIVTAGAQGGAGIEKVELYVNGILYATDNSYPYTFTWTPKTTGAFALLALAYDTNGNVVPSTSITPTSTTPVAGPDNIIIEAAPAIAITAPGAGSTISAGALTPVQAVAVDTNLDASGKLIPISTVQFYQDGTFVGASKTPVSGDLYQISYKPTQNIVNGVVEQSQLTAIATDMDGFQGTSSAVNVNVNSGGSSTTPTIIGTPPTITITTPTNNSNVVVNTPVTFSATGNAPNGNISSVAFAVDGAVVATLTQYPYSYTYTFKNLGTYQVSATVTDNVGDTYTPPSPTIVTVGIEPPPTVNITSPTTGGILTTGSSVTVSANASSLSGTIAQIQFFENGVAIGTATTPPYTESFTPLSAGIYTFTAIATDGAGETTTTSPVIVEVFPATSGLGTTSYFGQYQGITDGGRFAFITLDGTLGTYIGHSTTATTPTTAFYPDIAVSPGGALSSKFISGGEVSSTGVSGSLVPSNDLLIGAATQAGSLTVAAGYYTGNIAGQSGSQVTGILGNDGELMVYISSGSYTDVADGSVDSTGALSITTTGNNTLTGTINPTTGFFMGTLSGPSGGTIAAARVSGGTFSDGVIKNISTRGQVGTGSSAMIAGFVVGGTTAKQLLVRAVGPALESFGLSTAVAATALQVYSGSTLVASNTGWSSTPVNTVAVQNADTQVGAFALPLGSGDSALVGSFAPGAYTAMVSPAGSAIPGIGLVEIYDMDTYTPFTAMKLTNVSTRGLVGTGNNVLIGGFSFNGTASKRLLIRGAGPGLIPLGVSGALATPHLQLFNNSGALVRENFAWQTGNDSGMVSAAEIATGAFAFATGSADSAILVDLPPGTYTAEVSGAANATGDALIEIYEVP